MSFATILRRLTVRASPPVPAASPTVPAASRRVALGLPYRTRGVSPRGAGTPPSAADALASASRNNLFSLFCCYHATRRDAAGTVCAPRLGGSSAGTVRGPGTASWLRCGFTLIELLVVIAMIVLLCGAFATSVQKAQERARVARATQEIREMTNAILSYENYAPNHRLEPNGGWAECTEAAMAMILGRKTDAGGQPVPVLYNGHVVGGQLRDPWNRPYQFMIRKTSEISSAQDEETAQGLNQLKTAAALPNMNRLTDEERGL